MEFCLGIYRVATIRLRILVTVRESGHSFEKTKLAPGSEILVRSSSAWVYYRVLHHSVCIRNIISDHSIPERVHKTSSYFYHVARVPRRGLACVVKFSFYCYSGSNKKEAAMPFRSPCELFLLNSPPEPFLFFLFLFPGGNILPGLR